MFAASCLLVVGLIAPVPATKADELKKEQEACWTGLLGNEHEATRAILKLAAKPKESIVFLKSKLKPLILDEKDAKKRIEELGSDDEKVVKAAAEYLEYFDPRLALSLQKCVDETPATTEQRGRLIMILSDRPISSLKDYNVQQMALRSTGPDSYNFFDGRLSWWAEHDVKKLGSSGWFGKKHWVRANRAIILLEHIGTLEAVEVLKTMATGHADASPTTLAKEALKKIGR